MLVLMLACIPLSAFAAASPIARVEGVDYTRVEENEQLQKQVTITVGGREFTGTLSNGKTLSENEVDAIIKRVMSTGSDKPITSGMLLGAQQRMSQALKYDDKRYVHPRVLMELMLSGAGVSNAQELTLIATGAEGAPKLDSDLVVSSLSGTALGKLFDAALGYVTGCGTVLNLAGWVKSTADIGVREYMEYLESDEKAQQAVAAALALEQFYAMVNSEIKKAEKEKGENSWSIKCAQTVWTKKSLFGVGGVMQYWRLSCNLKREIGTDDPMNWGGKYTGTMKLDIWHDLTPFDESFKAKFYLSSALPFSQIAGWYDIKDKYTQPSSLTKTLKNDSFSIILNPIDAEAAGATEQPFSFSGFEDDTRFWAMHPVWAGLDIAVIKSGEFHWSGYGAKADLTENMTHYFVGEVTDGNRAVHVDMYGWNNVSTFSLFAPYNSISEDDSESGMDSMTVATDSQIFEDLIVQPVLTVD